MAQEIEIELKQLLMKEEFEQLKQHFQLKDSDFHTQTNHYFDTPQFDIKSQFAALRMREKRPVGSHVKGTTRNRLARNPPNDRSSFKP